MRVAKLQIEGLRGIRSGTFLLGRHCALIGPNGAGKSTIVDALSLVLGRSRMVRTLTEHDFTGSTPKPADRIRIVATLTDFKTENPDDHTDWFRWGRAVPKWVDALGNLHGEAGVGRTLCAQVGLCARFDHAELNVETIRFFHDDDDVVDPFMDEDAVEQVPQRLLNDLGYFVLPARRTWEGVTSFNSELFRRTISNAAGIPADEILAQRDQLRAPAKPLETSPALTPLVQRLNEALRRLLYQAPRFGLRVTAGDAEAVLQALQPHYDTGTAALPASRHGAGLLSLQTLLLLLEVGRARREKGEPFLLALEEPELHLAPGLQARLVAEAMRLADQTICTTHSPRVAGIYPATNVLVMETKGTAATAAPLLKVPLQTTASNNDRKLFLVNRVRVVEALMHPHVLVPEGRFDCEWLLRLSEIADARTSTEPPFSTVWGIVPTENASVVTTTEKLRALRTEVVALVDGDSAGDGYLKSLAALPSPPRAAFAWPRTWTIEDVVGWLLEPGGAAVLASISTDLGGRWSFTTLPELVALLRTPNNPQAKVHGLKEETIAHESIANAIRESEPCAARVSELFEALVHLALGTPHPRLVEEAKGPPRRLRFDAT